MVLILGDPERIFPLSPRRPQHTAQDDIDLSLG